YPHMTVYENMAFGLRLRKYPGGEIDRRVREAAQMLNIQDLLDRRPKVLSGGERQRVAVGRAIVRKPAAFLFDEPLSNLDAKLRVEMRVELKRLHARLQSTMIYVTHDQVEAMTLGERIVVMDGGRIQQVDEPIELYGEPANEFVAGFIGTPPMNFFPGTIEQAAAGLVFTDGHARIAIPAVIEPAVREAVGRQVKLGVRPENVYDRAFVGAPPPGSTMEARVEVVEALGNEKLVYLSTPRSRFICKMEAHQKVGAGAELEVVLDLNRIHIFDAATGRNLTAKVRAGRAAAV
ncbi:MAG: ATP-binding cassette domain-containing protein, partial [Planctomycetota bacterium]|nr:ATP-binding cassette domain-containing protein [Planctomycetota bacterium]